MSSSLDSVTATTKLRREKLEVEAELKEKRTEYARRMEQVKEREERLKVRRQALQNELVSFYKLIQENEIKRNRANKKALGEEQAKEQRHAKIVEMSLQLKTLERQKTESRERYHRYVKYQRYLDEVLARNDNEEFQDPRDIITRYHTLDDNREVLQRRKEQLEQTVLENKQKLALKEKRNKNDEVTLQYELGALQSQLEALQKTFKKKQDDFENGQEQKGQNVKTIGQVRMACQNLFDRCLRFNLQYRGRVGREESETDMMVQLQMIGDNLEDYHQCINEWKRKLKMQEQQQLAAAAAVGGGVATIGAAGGGGAASGVPTMSKLAATK